MKITKKYDKRMLELFTQVKINFEDDIEDLWYDVEYTDDEVVLYQE